MGAPRTSFGDPKGYDLSPIDRLIQELKYLGVSRTQLDLSGLDLNDQVALEKFRDKVKAAREAKGSTLTIGEVEVLFPNYVAGSVAAADDLVVVGEVYQQPIDWTEPTPEPDYGESFLPSYQDRMRKLVEIVLQRPSTIASVQTQMELLRRNIAERLPPEREYVLPRLLRQGEELVEAVWASGGPHAYLINTLTGTDLVVGTEARTRWIERAYELAWGVKIPAGILEDLDHGKHVRGWLTGRLREIVSFETMAAAIASRPPPPEVLTTIPAVSAEARRLVQLEADLAHHRALLASAERELELLSLGAHPDGGFQTWFNQARANATLPEDLQGRGSIAPIVLAAAVLKALAVL